MISTLGYDKDWSQHFCLDETSPSGISRIRSKFGNTILKTPVGTKNFKVDGRAGGWRVKLKGHSYYIHRIIWVLTHGSVDPELVIDHLDGNPFNNTTNNLFLKSPENNMRNRHKHRNNKTGVTGVYITSNKSGNIYYVAAWYNSTGELESKFFSVLKLGEENAKLLASNHRKDQILRLINEGADYTDRHGT